MSLTRADVEAVRQRHADCECSVFATCDALLAAWDALDILSEKVGFQVVADAARQVRAALPKPNGPSGTAE